MLIAASLLLLVYVGLSFLNNENGYLGTDTGGKVITLAAMQQHHTWTDPDIGYWAKQWDPTGSLHPYYGTKLIDGHWVQVSTLPMIIAAEPLWRLGGYRLTLLLPMIGGVLSALAARSLANRLQRDPRIGWLAFVLTGLASPVLLYSLDLWEHSLGLAAMAWAVVALERVVSLDTEGPSPLRRTLRYSALAGAGFGLASTMRTEALVYLVAFVGVACLFVLARDRHLVRPIVCGVSALVVAGAFFVANNALETAILGAGIRSGRATSTAATAGSDLPLRLHEALTYAVGLFASDSSSANVANVLVVAVIGWMLFTTRSTSKERPVGLIPTTLMAIVAGLYLVRFAQGTSFVSGLLTTTPFAVAGVVMVRRTTFRARYLIAASLVALPLAWATEYTGGAGPQWGGRYILLSGLVLAVVGISALRKLHPVGIKFLIGLAVAISAFGFVWMVNRTHGAAAAGAHFRALPQPVLVFDRTLGFTPREFAAYTEGTRWLVAPTTSDNARAAGIVQKAKFSSFGFVQVHGERSPSRIGSFRRGPSTTISFIGIDLKVTTYRVVRP